MIKPSGFAVFLFRVMSQYAKDHGQDALERALHQAKAMMAAKPHKKVTTPPKEPPTCAG